MDTEEPLSEHEKRSFSSLSRKAPPPKELTEEIIHHLKNEGQIKTESKILPFLLRIAASLLLGVGLFGAGYFTANYQHEKLTTSTMNGYIMILHEDDSMQSGDPLEMYNEYSEWMKNTYERGVEIDGQELKPEALMVKSTGNTAIDGQSADRVTGYFILKAKSLEEVQEIAKGNPHVKYGGTIEIKEFMIR